MKELSLAGCSPFDDRLESYEPWKTTFQQTIQDLHVTPLEEVDLLFRWLHPVIQICIEYKDRYGSQIIVAYVKKILEKFPKDAFRDPKKLCDMHDLCLVQFLIENSLNKKLFGH